MVWLCAASGERRTTAANRWMINFFMGMTCVEVEPQTFKETRTGFPARPRCFGFMLNVITRLIAAQRGIFQKKMNYFNLTGHQPGSQASWRGLPGSGGGANTPGQQIQRSQSSEQPLPVFFIPGSFSSRLSG